MLLDLNVLGQGKKFVELGAFVVSDDQNLLAYTVDYVGYRQFSLQVKDLRTGETLPDTAERVDDVAWAADSRTLFLTTEDEVTKRANRAWRHTLGQKEFEPVYEDKDETFWVDVDKTRDKKYLLLSSGSTDTREVRYLKADQPKSDFTVFLPREKQHRYFLDLMNSMMDPSLPLTTTDYLEWGNPNDKAAYDYMLKYSPYDNLHKAAFPPMLFTESLNDSQVPYWEAAKFVAKARTLTTDNNPILLKMKMDPAGHSGASGRYEQIHDRAFEYAWMLSQAGITK